jgi:hypothetical protein
MDQMLTALPSLPTPIGAGDAIYVVRAGVDYQATLSDFPTEANAETTVPASSSAAGEVGQWAYDSGTGNYYRCVATNTWIFYAVNDSF